MPDKTTAPGAASRLDAMTTHLLASLDPDADMARMITQQAILLDLAFNTLIVEALDEQTGHVFKSGKFEAAFRSQRHFRIAVGALIAKNAATNKLNRTEAGHAPLER